MKTINEYVDAYIEHRIQHEGMVSTRSTCIPVKMLKAYCMRNNIFYLTQEYIDSFCVQSSTEAERSWNSRIGGVRRFLMFVNKQYNQSFILPEHRMKKKEKAVTLYDRPLTSSLIKSRIDDYMQWLKASGKLSEFTHYWLIRFNNFCAENYPDEKYLTKEILNHFGEQHEGETANSRNLRLRPVISFVKFAYKHGWINVSADDINKLPNKRRSGYVPHDFSREELQTLFERMDKLQPKPWESDRSHNIRRIQPPVYMRLIYSTGMRTNEARCLRRSDVDLKEGVINIHKTRTNVEHRVALHPSMLELLIKYDNAMNKLMPDRKMFFPSHDDKVHLKRWQSDYFRRVWKTISDRPARAYDLRSHYAVTNINSWDYDNTDWIDKLLYLSRSMGHKKISSTCYYYQLVPSYYKTLAECSGSNLESLLPNLDNFFEHEDQE